MVDLVDLFVDRLDDCRTDFTPFFVDTLSGCSEGGKSSKEDEAGDKAVLDRGRA